MVFAIKQIFRLSDTNVYLKTKPTPDWMDKLHAADRRIDKAEDKLDDQEADLREAARELGRKQAARAAKKVDTVFHPNKFNSDDAIMFQYVDFLIFNGMKS